MSSPGIVHKVRFVTSSKKEFSGYVEYVDRDEAKRNEYFQTYSLYNDYMGNPDKTSGMFSDKQDDLSSEDKKTFKQAFKHAQENGSLMWQDVFSFDNKWLEKHGLYDSKSGIVDELKIMQAVRQSMVTMTKKENMELSALWLGAIHFNTDNIHVHVATVEVPPTRDRGKRKPKTLEQMKSTFANSLLDMNKQNEKINSLIRQQMIGQKQHHSSDKDREMRKQFRQMMNKLPKEDVRKWNYAYMKNLGLQDELDNLSKTYIETHHKKEFDELQKTLQKQKNIYRETYGEGTKEKRLYEHFVENKNKDLYKRMGNVLLKEMKDHQYKQMKMEDYRSSNNLKPFPRKGIITSGAFHKIKQALHNEVDHFKNQVAYEQLEQKIQYETER